MMKRSLLLLLVLATLTIGGRAMPAQTGRAAPRPNVIVMLVDDMGYADIHLNGNPVIQTPNIDQMARDGLQLTSLYAAPLCTPTRGMLLTSRYPPRTGIINVTGPGSPQGLRSTDITIAEALRPLGYRTAMFGKWHIGDFDTNPAWNPTAHGFDEFLGLPYSHDYNPPDGVPLYHGTTKVEQPVRYNLLTRRYTEDAIRFIRNADGHPFFVYLAHNMPHIPVGTSDAFKGHSRGGRYGDAIEEVDWSVGEIIRTLKELNLDRNTIMVFQSDNGPWVSAAERLYDRGERGTKIEGDVGWPGLLRGSKGTTYEGGVRVPAIVRWPGTIPAGGISADIVSVMDWFPTFVALAGGTIAPNRPLDGVDISGFLKGRTPDPRSEVFYYGGANIQAVRQGSWKLRIGPPEPAMAFGAANAPARGGRAATAGRGRGAGRGVAPGTGRAGRGRGPTAMLTELFNVDTDPAERFNVAAEHPDIVARLRARMTAFGESVQATRQAP
jgi:arylsulfatase A-like enzyme